MRTAGLPGYENRVVHTRNKITDINYVFAIKLSVLKIHIMRQNICTCLFIQ